MNNLPLAYNVTFVGLVVVFASLIILAALIFLFTSLIARSRKRAQSIDISEDASALEIDEDEPAAKIEPSSDEELIAVITAAINAAGNSHPDVKLYVRSYRRISGSSPVWNAIGRKEQLASKL